MDQQREDAQWTDHAWHGRSYANKEDHDYEAEVTDEEMFDLPAEPNHVNEREGQCPPRSQPSE
jgi:hypothetical protein